MPCHRHRTIRRRGEVIHIIREEKQFAHDEIVGEFGYCRRRVAF
jgi:hypothetical protein